jgi:hypothetical protein
MRVRRGGVMSMCVMHGMMSMRRMRGGVMSMRVMHGMMSMRMMRGAMMLLSVTGMVLSMMRMHRGVRGRLPMDRLIVDHIMKGYRRRMEGRDARQIPGFELFDA